MSDRTTERHQIGVRQVLLSALGLSAACVVVLLVSVGSWRRWLLGLNVVPIPPHVADAVDVMVLVNNAIRDAAPVLAAVAIAYMLLHSALAWFRPSGRTVMKLSRIEFSGVDHLNSSVGQGRLVRGWRGVFRGTALATLAIVLVSATSGVETEVSNGPLRPVDQLLDVVSGGQVSLVLQAPNVTFMDESALPATYIDRLVAAGDREGIEVVPFGKHLFNLSGGSALELSLPDALYEKLSGNSDAGRPCSERTAIVDSTTKADVGDMIMLNDTELRVVGVRDQAAQMNRSIAPAADSTVRECVLSSTSSNYFGAVVGGSADRAEDLMATVGLSRFAAVTEATFKENNRDFWRANATPILLQLILYLALFSAFAAAGERQSMLQRNSREIGMLLAMGVSIRTLRAVERRRAYRTTLIATLVATPLAFPVVAAFNASELGTRIGIGPTELSVGFILVLLAMLTGSRRSLTRFEKTLDLPTAVKG